MAKLSATLKARAKKMGFVVTTEEQLRSEILPKLSENGADGFENEDIDLLVDIAESYEITATSQSEVIAEDPTEEVVDSETAEAEELAKEAEEEEAESQEEEVEGDELTPMTRVQLKQKIKKEGIAVTVKKSMSDEDIRVAIRVALQSVDSEDDEVEEEEVDETPVKKLIEKKVTKPAKERTLTVSKRGTKLDPKNNEEDRSVFEVFHEIFPTEEYAYAWVVTAGVTIKLKGKNSQRSLVLIENCRAMPDETVKCNLYLLTMTKEVEVLDELGIDYETCWSGQPFVKNITFTEAIEVIEQVKDNVVKVVNKIDKKLGESRKKMEDNLKKTTKK